MRCDAGLVTITHGRYLNGWLRRSRVRKRRVAGACCVTSSTYILLESSLLGSRPFYFLAIYLFFPFVYAWTFLGDMLVDMHEEGGSLVGGGGSSGWFNGGLV